jgi:FkbM family methyltransferase
MVSNELYTKSKSKKIPIHHVCEVGVYSPALSNILDFITRDRTRTTLVEPMPDSIAAIRKDFGKYPNVHLYPVAIYDYHGTLELASRGESTFATTLPFSPAMVNDNYVVKNEDTFSVECQRFDEIDDGTIDLLSVDTEGCEWYILKYMRSRPAIISLETHGKTYSNPYLSEINTWMTENGYKRWFINRTDTIYYKEGALTPDWQDGLQLWWREAKVKLRKLRKSIGKKSPARTA